jgi:hypothetical protein
MMAFGEYAKYYDLLYADKDYAAETTFVREIIRRLAPGARTLLELGCGSARRRIQGMAHRQSLATAILVRLCRGASDPQLRIRVEHSATRWHSAWGAKHGVVQARVGFEFEAPGYLTLQRLPRELFASPAGIVSHPSARQRRPGSDCAWIRDRSGTEFQGFPRHLL